MLEENFPIIRQISILCSETFQLPQCRQIGPQRVAGPSHFSQKSPFAIVSRETPRGNFGIFTIVAEGKRGLSYGSGERQEMTGILCGRFENKLVGFPLDSRAKDEK